MQQTCVNKRNGISPSIRFLLLLNAMLFTLCNVMANNISVSNAKLSTQNATTNTVRIDFNLSWENSFRLSTGPANWDAAWVFVKYRVAKASGGDGIWRHVSLATVGHLAPVGSLVRATPEGAIIHRSAAGTGTFTVTGAGLSWNYGTHVESGTNDFIDDDDAIEIKIFAIEMVYVPAGAYNVGGGGGPTSFTSTNISNANASLIGTGYPTGGSNNNAAFPNGFAAYYCMKYEISQQQYVDFLNTLTLTQQKERTTGQPTNPPGSAVLFYNTLSNYTNPNLFRNSIDVKISSRNDSAAEYACNLDGDLNFSEENDGQWLACNFLFYTDWLAYLDWSGLRPMTELEFEKACRGNQPAVADEYAWGSANFLKADGLTNAGAIDEIPSNTGSNVHFDNNNIINGPMRVGSFANATSSRALAGASWYGIMDLTGNVKEAVVFAGTNPTYTGVHGNGQLNAEGNNDVNLWPGSEPNQLSRGIGYRGGSWFKSQTVSWRGTAITVLDEIQYNDGGGRGVRTAP